MELKSCRVRLSKTSNGQGMGHLSDGLMVVIIVL